MLLNGMGGLSGLQDTAWHSGLRIHCHTCGVGMGRSDLIHGLGTPGPKGVPKKRRNKVKRSIAYMHGQYFNCR